MAEPIIMPKAGMLMHTGTIIEWYVTEGASVRKGDPVAHIETDKATMNIEAETGGTVLKILHSSKDVVPVTRPIAWIGTPGETVPESYSFSSIVPVNLNLAVPLKIPGSEDERSGPVPLNRTHAPQKNAASVSGRVPQPRLPKSGDRIAATPAARRISRELGIPLESVVPSGRSAQVLSSDVLYAARKLSAQDSFLPFIEEGDSFLPLSSVQQSMADHLMLSVQSIPYTSCTVEVDVTDLLESRRRIAEEGTKITINAFALAALAAGLTVHRRFNSQYDRDRLVIKGAVNIGIAVSTPRGLVVPVLKHADRLSLVEISTQAEELARAVNSNTAGPELLEGATITLSNLGSYGITEFVPLINPPQSAILGAGCVRQLFLPDSEGRPQLRSIMSLTLTYDHRVGGGADAAQLLAAVRNELEHPQHILKVRQQVSA
jgi:pyruvate dehydrogenase E2 component (dihydrolipoamide acetyltransferase)